MAETTIRLGSGSKAEHEPQQESKSDQQATNCPACHRNFSPNAEFCPFDGEGLTAWDFQTVVKDPLIGSVIDERYEVLAVIGEGGMGRVYRVRHQRLGRSFALKALRLELSKDSTLTQRFIQEARAAAVVSHPNVVQINDFGTLPSGQPYFVMELLEGRTLTRILREEGPMDPGRCAAMSVQLADALAAAHAMGVIHRDLKPDNVIVIRPTGAHMTVKVLDFGLAKVAVNSRLTRPGVVFGTPHYLSPEQAGGEPYDHRVDIYALGVMMFEMVTGRVPFEADTYMGVLTKHLYAAPPRPCEYHAAAGALPGFEDIISGCLAKKPAERWPSMVELARKLGALSIKPDMLRPRHPVLPALSYQGNARLSQPLAWYAVVVGVYVSMGGLLLWIGLVRGCASHRASGVKPAASSPASSSASIGLSAAPLASDAVSAPPEPPSLRPALATSVKAEIPPKGPPDAGRPPPAAKRGRSDPKPLVKNKKIPSLGSGDLADPWAK